MKEQALANAAAITIGAIYIVCSILVVLLPGFFKVVSQSWFHGVDLSLIWTGSARGNFLLGLITAVVGAWLVGYIFAWFYNQFAKK
ncbi:MAG: hypothetical protein UT92_C0013G0012 [Candidatus Curtissbacteria bacterium GW2011_GWA1_40_24]|uniref:Uncharacterized protein n=1 Tax=Candidatus Curtissbacteria bacterium GW2011_GWA1_40_24 TaxID=1618406 RepID=A0A0G0RXV8_9BACT|nr:MAG: hypothetical protein UT92_C0013G0012 [Candidatus Curtissbacteria bacterium GW2011_GWA1_40_24]